ncbi:crotonase/enoyl-CoA hydratase family protein [Nonomuraea lactucae]|uniref:crotonase/enoyl-CoA hydratase family protein n=1 Tax=Nonomuraea lactucae TaxID=2249762 RepID=UPI001F05AA19|nr:crotonase/enoyl-CoA hydratase family protein [Nonomuraea lactucae]
MTDTTDMIASTDANGTSAVVLTEIRGDAGIMTLNRPRVRNALNLELREAMQSALESFDAEPSVAVIVLTGAGGNFCSGRDLRAVAAGEPMYSGRPAQLAAFTRVSVRKPVIAAIEGYALAGGFELALSCDLLVASREAVFGLPEVRRNLVAIGGGLIRLPQRMPYHLAMQLVLTGEHVGARRLAEAGVVTELAEPGAALETALALAERIAANGPSAVRASKEIVRRAFEWSGESEAFDAQLAVAEPALSSPDREEGVRAFLERRDPVWTDR